MPLPERLREREREKGGKRSSAMKFNNVGSRASSGSDGKVLDSVIPKRGVGFVSFQHATESIGSSCFAALLTGMRLC